MDKDRYGHLIAALASAELRNVSTNAEDAQDRSHQSQL